MKKTFPLLFLLLIVNIVYGQQYYVQRDYTYNVVTVPDTFEYIFNNTRNPENLIMKNGDIYCVHPNFIKKFLDNGTLDPNFGQNGSFNPNGMDFLITLNGIYLYSFNQIVKYNINGTIDLSYGQNGFANFGDLNNSKITNILVNEDGSVYVFTKSTDYAVSTFRVLPNGNYDTGFGMKYFGVGVRSILKGVNNSFFLLRDSSTNYKLIKYTTQGEIDNSFGNQGSIDILNSSVQFYINNIGEIFLFDYYKIEKYTTSGQKDISFGTNGTFVISSFNPVYPMFGDVPVWGRNIEFDDDNSILIFGHGTKYSSSFIFIGKITSSGILDTNFNGGSSYFLNTQSEGIFKGVKTNDGFYKASASTRLSMTTNKLGIIRYKRVDGALQVSEANIQKLQIYPNPIEDILTIELNANEKLQKLNIYAIDGRLVFTGTELKSNLKFLPSGDYIAEIKTSKNTYSKKIIKK
ncbi:Por secretion system C-terminal sorting domain-containing protein [Chryseobacterium ureilyticum]|uniref:Por secretion system C-terminal sorting domain-containing protein n=1 Tax=Chryseobacterium ureilyticum TaxID=373668 RepID=A0A1N7QN36_9FLAO|nr:T9SS type A sorting domain-containing protein [Chryseobacterium ureilyticum]SIT24253.1 Por secretion system C-terminal sorting domain-containing protein [Chryseobacterium ureilyticum]